MRHRGGTDISSATDESVVDAVLTASRTLVAVATQSLGAAAEDTTIAQYRALVVLASRGPQRLVDVARALGVTPSTAGRMCDRLDRKGLIRRHRARSDRREVQVSITTAGREVVDHATARRRALLAEILSRLPGAQQTAVAVAFQAFAAAAGEVPDSQWPREVADAPSHLELAGRPDAVSADGPKPAAAGTSTNPGPHVGASRPGMSQGGPE